jgi:diguanylate cyclase (GGDEF)-like protein
MQKEKMAEINRTDALTKALTRKGIASVAEDLITQKNLDPFCLLIFDIDHFKNLNDYYGHILGDKVLRMLVAMLKKEMRDGDVIGRYGGDEFIILLPKIDKRSAYRTAERFRMTISKTEDPHFTISMGMAFYPDDGKHFEELVHYADLGLYKAKEKGRNRVGYAGEFE